MIKKFKTKQQKNLNVLFKGIHKSLYQDRKLNEAEMKLKLIIKYYNSYPRKTLEHLVKTHYIDEKQIKAQKLNWFTKLSYGNSEPGLF